MMLYAYRKDAALAVALAAASAGAMLLAPAGRADFDALAWVLGLSGSLALAVRRFPLAVLALTVLAVLLYQLRGYPDGSPVLPVLLAVYRAVRSGHKQAALAITFGGLALSMGMLAFIAMDGDELKAALERRVLLLGWVAACAMAAEMRRHFEAHLDAAEERAEAQAQLRAGEERLRIARELHDTLTHSISVIKMQAGVAVHLADKRGEEPLPALRAIQEASGDAARELRSTLHVLRNGAAEQVGLAWLPALVERAEHAGVRATMTVSGEQRPLAPEVDRAAYRIVQESLTNVARHAGAAQTKVQLSYARDTLSVQIEDNGSADPALPPLPGVGITGMRERVTALGGELHAGPRPSGGFTVRAMLPLQGGTP